MFDTLCIYDHASAHMATARTFKLVIVDGDTVAQEDTCDLPATGLQLFNIINARCEFPKWSECHAWLNIHRRFDIYWLGRAGDNQASVISVLDRLVAAVARFREPFGFTCQIEIMKNLDPNTAPGVPKGPQYGSHPGVRPDDGPGQCQPGAYIVRPAGPEGHNLSEMRALLHTFIQ
jgi:hypothetical protein